MDERTILQKEVRNFLYLLLEEAYEKQNKARYIILLHKLIMRCSDNHSDQCSDEGERVVEEGEVQGGNGVVNFLLVHDQGRGDQEIDEPHP